MDWLTVMRGDAPLIVSVPHAGTTIPDDIACTLTSLERARHDADYHVDKLYAFACDMGATLIKTAISRTVIDVNRDPSGQSLYPGQMTTGLCPETSFDGISLYRAGTIPDSQEINRRRIDFFDPYHRVLSAEISRLRSVHPAIVVYDAHSILSCVPRLFAGELPQFNIGSFDGASCSADLTDAVRAICAPYSHVANGRFKGGWITRHYGNPHGGVHAIQMELAMRGYLDESDPWPPTWDPDRAAPLQQKLRDIVAACLSFARNQS